MRATFPTLFFLLLGFLCSVAGLPAATAGEDEGGVRYVGDEDSLKVYTIDAVVVERTRADLPASPVAFSEVDQEDIRKVSYGQDVPMVLSYLPGTYAYSDAGNGFGYTYLKIRGFDQNRLGFLLNGVPFNDPESHQVYWVDHGDVLAGAKSVQVQRGVGTTQFGASSFGGSVNVLTSPFSVDPGIHLTAGYGNFTDGNLDLPARVLRAAFATGPMDNGTTALYARYSRMDSDGYREASAAKQESFNLSGLYAGEYGNHKLDLLVGNQASQAAWDGVSPQLGFDLDDREERRFNTYAVYGNEVDDFRQSVGSLTSEFALGGETKLSNTLYYVDGLGYFEQFKPEADLWDYGFDPVELPDTTIDESDLVRRRWLDNGYWGLLPQITTPLAGGRATAGLGFRRYWSEHYGELVWSRVPLPADPLERYYTYDTDKWTLEAYGKAELPLDASNRTILTAGLQYQGHRYDFRQQVMGNFLGYEFEANHNFLNPQLGVRHGMENGISLFASASYNQREPSDSDYIDADDPSSAPAFEGADSLVTNLTEPLVQPEKVLDLELGANWNRERWEAGLSLYYMDFRDELIPIEGGRVEEEGRLIRANANRTLHLGLELEGAYRFGNGAFAGANLAFARHRFVDHEIYAYWLHDYEGGLLKLDGNRIPRSAEVLANLVAGLPTGPVTWGVQVQYVGKQYVDGENTENLAIDPYAVANLSAKLELGRYVRQVKGLALEARVLNVFDSLYETWGYSYYDDYPPRPFAFYWPGATRSYRLTLSMIL